MSMRPIELSRYLSRSRALDLSVIIWDDIRRHPLPDEVVRTLRYMQDIESHTIIYLRQLLSTRAVDDPEVATFLACWFYEETFHGIALDRFLAAAGHPVEARPRPRSAETFKQRMQGVLASMLSAVWPDFVALHMTWGAINELTTLTGYRRLSELAGHPVLTELLGRIMRDESRHFSFYFRQAEMRLQKPSTARIVRIIAERFWSPVGSGVQPECETRFLARYLLTDPDGIKATKQIDSTIGRLPGFQDARLMQRWIEKNLGSETCVSRTSASVEQAKVPGAGVPAFPG